MHVYRHSGTIAPSGLLLASLLGAGAAAVLGFLYTWAIVWIPFVYINFLLTLGLGGAIGCVVAQTAMAGKVRNDFIAAALAVICGGVGLYVAWAADARARLSGEAPLLLLDPEALCGYVTACYALGTWGITSSPTAEVANNLSGPLLGLVWLAEAGMVLGTAGYVGRALSIGRVFCERCQSWVQTEKNVQRLSLLESDPAWIDRLAAGDLSVAAQMPRARDDDPAYLQLDLSCCPTCKESNYLTVQTVEYERDQMGKLHAKEKPLVRHLVIQPRDVEPLRNVGTSPSPAAEQAVAWTCTHTEVTQ